MPIDDLLGSLSVPARDTERDRFLRDYAFRKPDDSTGPGTQPYVDASTMADAVMPLYSDIRKVAQALDPTQITGAELKRQAEADGCYRADAVGASGGFTIGAATTGTHLFVGDEVVIGSSRYKCNREGVYYDGDSVPIIGIDTGPTTNQSAGAVGQWSSPRPGCAQKGTVTAQSDGYGLTGGRNQETDEEWRARWQDEKRTPRDSGNEAEFIAAIQDSKAHGVSVQKGFWYPCILGPGTGCGAFVLTPSSDSATRIPNATQIGQVLAYLKGRFPADDGIMMATIVAEQVNLELEVTWDPDASGWADLNPWPAYYPYGGQALIIGSATGATAFRISSDDGTYGGIVAPSAGTTIAVYDKTTSTFYRKKLLSVSGTGPWDVVCDTTNGASDTSYTPLVNQRVMPWSDSLQSMVAPLQRCFQALGPGEQVSTFFDTGLRQRRVPTSPGEYPSALYERDVLGALKIQEVDDANVIEPSLPLTPSVGTPGVVSNLSELGYLSVFPQ